MVRERRWSLFVIVVAALLAVTSVLPLGGLFHYDYLFVKVEFLVSVFYCTVESPVSSLMPEIPFPYSSFVCKGVLHNKEMWIKCPSR